MRKNNSRDIGESISPELEVSPVPEVNEYYIDISNKLKTAKFIILLFLIVFILFMISVFRHDVTLENFKYLVRFISSADTVYSAAFEDIYYDASGVLAVDMFNEDLVTAKTDTVQFYDTSGSKVAEYEMSQANPTMITGGKYLLIYDLGGNTIELYNNFSNLTSISYDYPISCAAVSSEGMYAVVTKGLEYQSVIYLYDHNFNLISKIFKDKYIMDIKISDSGDKLLCVSSVAKNGDFRSEIMTYSPYSDAQESTVDLEGAFAVGCGFFSDGGYAVLTDRSFNFYNSSNELINKYELGNLVPTDVMILDEYAVLCYNENIVGSDSKVVVFDPEGNMGAEAKTEDKIMNTSAYGNDLYLLCDTIIYRLDMSDGDIYRAEVEAGATGIYVCDGNSLLVGYSGSAKVYKIGELFTETVTEE